MPIEPAMFGRTCSRLTVSARIAQPSRLLRLCRDLRTVSSTLVMVPATRGYAVYGDICLLYPTSVSPPYVDIRTNPHLVTFQKTGIKPNKSRRFAFSSCAFRADICSGHLNSLERILYEEFFPT